MPTFKFIYKQHEESAMSQHALNYETLTDICFHHETNVYSSLLLN